MLNRARNFLKRKRNDKNVGEPSQAIVPYSSVAQKQNEKEDTKKEGIIARAFRKIKRRILRICRPALVPALHFYKTPANGQKTEARYNKITPQVEKVSNKHSQPRYYIFNQFVDMRESRNYEFKTGGGAYPVNILPEHIRKYGSAFLNCNGGVLIAGVLDNGLVRGIYCDYRMEERIRSTLHKEMSEFYPPVDRNLYSVYFAPVFDQRLGKYLYNIKVVEILFKGGEPLAMYECGRHMVYLKREGSVDGPLTPLQIKDVVLCKYRSVLKKRREQNVTLLSP